MPCVLGFALREGAGGGGGGSSIGESPLNVEAEGSTALDGTI